MSFIISDQPFSYPDGTASKNDVFEIEGTRVIRRNNIEHLPGVESKIFQRQFPELYKYLLKQRQIDLSILHQEEKIMMPSLRLLDKLAKSYQEKYGITIRLYHKSQIPNLLEELFQIQELKPIGIIVFDADFKHVTPFLFHAKNGKYELLIMDSFGTEPPLSTCEVILKANIPQECNRFISKESRQADSGSCNVGATTLLRNALIHIKYLGPDFDTLEHLIRPLQYNEDRNLICHLPGQWTYIDQITSAIEPNEWNEPCIKHLYTNYLKNREFDKEASQIFCSERVTIAERLRTLDNSPGDCYLGKQVNAVNWPEGGTSENKKCEAGPTPSKTDSSGSLCIVSGKKTATLREVNDSYRAPIYCIVTIVPTLQQKNLLEHLVNNYNDPSLIYENNTIIWKTEKMVNAYLAKKGQKKSTALLKESGSE